MRKSFDFILWWIGETSAKQCGPNHRKFTVQMLLGCFWNSFHEVQYVTDELAKTPSRSLWVVLTYSSRSERPVFVCKFVTSSKAPFFRNLRNWTCFVVDRIVGVLDGDCVALHHTSAASCDDQRYAVTRARHRNGQPVFPGHPSHRHSFRSGCSNTDKKRISTANSTHRVAVTKVSENLWRLSRNFRCFAFKIEFVLVIFH